MLDVLAERIRITTEPRASARADLRTASCSDRFLNTRFRPAAARRCLLACLAAGVAALSAMGCDAFNPAFVDLVSGESAEAFATLDNAPGHVVIAFINNAEVHERLIAYLESPDGGGLSFTAAEKRALRPRVRARVLVTYATGLQTSIEFVDGTPDLVDPEFATLGGADLSENDLNHVVVLCNVARVELVPSSIEVFVPVELTIYRLVVRDFFSRWELIGQVPPRFFPLEVDEVDDNRNVTVTRNIDVRGVPAPVDNPTCGSVVSIVMNGALTVPFLPVAGGEPSYDEADRFQTGTIGGRYEFTVSIR